MKVKIFQIGFNKCGTTSLYHLFKKNGLPSVHWEEGKLAMQIISNIQSRKKCLYGCDEYVFYSDLSELNENEFIELHKEYKLFDLQYPNSKFILNVRNIDNWIQSRLNHESGGRYDMLRFFKTKYSLTTEQVISVWKTDWISHIDAVQKYFSKRRDDLLVFDIENGNPNEIVKFLKREYKIDGSLYGKHNATKNLIKQEE